ncbi:hypothetical protein DFJ73DRAFT_805867 [Zopfochytrium polystomum]|nr:hypothetical protein DFJ73DRAFT_805867 [Zopfochytrium polystomum]
MKLWESFSFIFSSLLAHILPRSENGLLPFPNASSLSRKAKKRSVIRDQTSGHEKLIIQLSVQRVGGVGCLS